MRLRAWRVVKWNPLLVQRAHKPWRAWKLGRHPFHRIVPSKEIQANLRLIFGRYNVCTNASKTTKWSLVHGELKNVIPILVERAHKPWRACKLGRQPFRRIVPSMEIQEKSRLILGRYKVCTNATNAPKRSWGHGEFKNVIPVSV